MKFGCHVSIKKGYLGAAQHAAAIKADAYQYFPKNPRSLSIKEFDEKDAAVCKEFCERNGIQSIAHTPYPTSLTPTEKKKELTIQSLKNDLAIANACGSVGVVVHFGDQISPENPLASYHLMIKLLNSVLDGWEGQCLILLENSAGLPGTMGTTMEELVQVRNLCEQPKKIGFCLDTCHAFSSGLWDGTNIKPFVQSARELGYFDHLKAIHFNNSKYPALSGKDRHANIFSGGCIKESQFEELIFTKDLKNIPLILETPSDLGVSHAEEIVQMKNKWG